MEKQQKNVQNNLIGQEEMHFITSVQTLKTQGLIEHSGTATALTRKAEEVKDDFNIILNQLNYIVTEADHNAKSNNFKLEEITISLGFSAKGKIAFIAEAGVEASIEVKFTRT